MADIFSVIADSTRREILGVLLDRRTSDREASVSEIVDALGVAQPTVSKHLKTLRDVGLVTVREDGQHRYYSLDAKPLDELEDWLMPFLFADDEAAGDGGIGAAAFAAWAGANVTTPLRSAAEQARIAADRAARRVEEVVHDPSPLGASIGRRLADRTFEARSRAHDVQSRLQEAQEKAQQRFVEGRKGHKADDESPSD